MTIRRLAALVATLTLTSSPIQIAHAAPRAQQSTSSTQATQNAPLVTPEHLTDHPVASTLSYRTGDVDWANRPLCITPEQGYQSQALVDVDGDGQCPLVWGRQLRDLEFTTRGTLVAGYGDYNLNIDTNPKNRPDMRVSITEYDPATDTWGRQYPTGSESIDTIRRLPDGSLAIPTTDPSNRPAAGQTLVNRSGYLTDTSSGSWSLVDDGRQMTHVYDVTRLPTGETWTFGSKNTSALAMRLTRYGQWVTGRQFDAQPWSDLASFGWRMYWGQQLEGKIVHGLTAESAVEQIHTVNPFGTWTKTSFPGEYSTNSAGSQVVRFKDDLAIINTATSTSWAMTSAGGQLTPSGLPVSVRDWYSAEHVDGYLYALDTNGGLWRTSSLTTGTWTQVLRVDVLDPGQLYSIAVHGKDVYLGTGDGEVLRLTGVLAPGQLSKASADRKSSR